MYHVLAVLKLKVNSHNITIKAIDLTTEDEAFDDVEIEDGNDDDFTIIDGLQNKKREVKVKLPLNCEGKEEQVKSHLYQLLLHYWQNPAKEGMISALLDPRTKNLSFISGLEKEETISSLYDEYQLLKESEGFTDTQTYIDLESSNSLLADMFTESQIAENEVNEYLSIPQVSFKIDPFKWWAGNQDRFPILSCLAKKYLSISATSTSSERLFSQAGNTMTSKRTQLNPKLFEKLLFLKKNYDVIGGIFPTEINE